MTPPKVLAKPAVGPATRLARSRSPCREGLRQREQRLGWNSKQRSSQNLLLLLSLQKISGQFLQEEEGEIACSKGACGKGPGVGAIYFGWIWCARKASSTAFYTFCPVSKCQVDISGAFSIASSAL